MHTALFRTFGFAFLSVAFLPAPVAVAEPVTRSEALKIAESYINHRWSASTRNVRHGKDASGVEIHTPDREGDRGIPADDCWVPDAENIGVAYKWGGFDTINAFDAGVRAGKAAGDVYTDEKRRKGGAAVSGDAVGIDCSGFISRCWRLGSKHSTSMLFGICQKLASPADLKPGDVMNTGEGHVLMFVKWSDAAKKRAVFYESAPFCKTRGTERGIAEMVAEGYQPLRYRQIKD